MPPRFWATDTQLRFLDERLPDFLSARASSYRNVTDFLNHTARHWFERWSERAFLVAEGILPPGDGVLTPEQDELLAKATAARKKVK